MGLWQDREAAVRVLFIALFLTSCAVTAPVPGEETPLAQPSPAEASPEGRKERKPKAKPVAPVAVQPPAPVAVQSPPISPVAHCAALEGGNLKATINAKLDCIKESVTANPAKP